MPKIYKPGIKLIKFIKNTNYFSIICDREFANFGNNHHLSPQRLLHNQIHRLRLDAVFMDFLHRGVQVSGVVLRVVRHNTLLPPPPANTTMPHLVGREHDAQPHPFRPQAPGRDLDVEGCEGVGTFT